MLNLHQKFRFQTGVKIFCSHIRIMHKNTRSEISIWSKRHGISLRYQRVNGYKVFLKDRSELTRAWILRRCENRRVNALWGFSIFITSTTLKTFKLVLTYTKNVKEPRLNNENFKEKERKKFLIFVMFTLAWILFHVHRCFVLFLDT